MKNQKIIKKITNLVNNLQKSGKVDFEHIEIKINNLLEKKDIIVDVLRELKIPFKIFYPIEPNYEASDPPEEVNLSFGYEINLKVIYLLVYLAKEIFNNDIIIYICYTTEPYYNKFSVLFGSYISKDKAFTNISQPITPNRILMLNLESIDWKEFSNLFPNANYSDHGRITDEAIYIDSSSPFDLIDFYKNKRENSGKYAGTYAQDVEGLSDDFIDDALGGEADAYWNID